jgi:hypothetical protein
MTSLNFPLSACALALLAVLASAEIHRVKIPAYQTDSPANGMNLQVFPINVAVRLGDVIEMECQTVNYIQSRVHWFEFVTTAIGQMISDNAQILSSHPNANRYRILQPTLNHFHLEIRDIQLADGGSYVCLDGNSGPPANYAGQAEIVVIVGEPNCTTQVPDNGAVIEGQNYTTQCQIYYRGNLAPTMTWTGPEPFYSAIITNDDDVYAGILFTVNRDMDTRAYRCTTNFTRPVGVPGGVADNAPAYEHIHQAGQLFVYWGPKNIYVVPLKPTYDVGDQVTCYADAFPPPFYQWQDMRTLEFFSTQTFTVTASMVGWNTTMRCQAQNLIQGFLFSADIFIQIYVPAPTTPTTPTTTQTTTPPPLDSTCFNISGWWRSEFPALEVHLTVASGQSARVTGFMRNGTDQQWIEVVGRTRLPDYRFLGLSAIWPYEIGVSGMSAECHRCSGVEVIIADTGIRSSADSVDCGDGGTPAPHTPYRLARVGSIGPQYFQSPDFKVYKPTREISGQFGVKF